MMPSTTRYSATFDRLYEEDERRSAAAAIQASNPRRSRSQSWQANINSSLNLDLESGGLSNEQQISSDKHRCSSTDDLLSERCNSTDGESKKEDITQSRTITKPAVKAHSNPFQFVKVGNSPLYKKAAEQLKKVKEIKKPEVLKEEEEEWQTNLDSWKNRRRKMSEDVFRRAEEVRQFEIEEQSRIEESAQRKTKKFSEIVESRANRGRAQSLCLMTSPLDVQKWEIANSNNATVLSEESTENSAFNSEDEGVLNKKILLNLSNSSDNSNGTYKPKNSSPAHRKSNGRLFENGGGSPQREGVYFDSGLESISSSNRTVDTPDSCSDFSQDSGSSIDCDSPRASGLIVNNMDFLTEFKSKAVQNGVSGSFYSNEESSTVNSCVSDKSQDYSKLLQNNNGHFNDTSVDKCDKIKSNRSPSEDIEYENEMFVDNFQTFDDNLNFQGAHDQQFDDAYSKPNVHPNSQRSSSLNTLTKSSEAESQLNIVFSSDILSENHARGQPIRGVTSSLSSIEHISLEDVPPVEKVAEEMEKLILQQLEEEERSKELLKGKNLFSSPEHNLIAPARLAEPPKEKPPPPPCSEMDVQKPASMKRTNSTKRIKKEILMRRSNFLGIENSDEITACDKEFIPPPPALDQILKAEMEMDREGRERLENAVVERIMHEKSEIIKREQEIIQKLELEEKQKKIMQEEILREIQEEEERIKDLQEERKKAEQEKQLKDREEQVKKQEADSLLSDAIPNISLLHNVSPLSHESLPNSSLDGVGTDNAATSSCNGTSIVSDISGCSEKTTVKPVVPPKPLKKKEAIRKERERLRQEQEELLQKKEHLRQKMLREQEDLAKKIPTPYGQCVTSSSNFALSAPQPYRVPVHKKVEPSMSRESVNGRNYAQNGIHSNGSDYADFAHPPAIKHKPVVAQKKPSLTHQKGSVARKQNPDSTGESKYNQNHWLIQEAEMRRISEMRERQHGGYQSPRPNPMAMPAMVSNQVQYANGYANMPIQKYPAVVGSDKHCPPMKPSRVVQIHGPDQILSVSGKKKCSHCAEELGRGAAMIIESLHLYFHIHCFQCCVCQAQLGNGSCGTDVRVRNNKLHCHNCYSNDEEGLKCSQV